MKEYKIFTKDGELLDIDEYLFKENDFKYLVDKEVFSRSHSKGTAPKALKYIEKFGIEWEEMSDRGHMRYQPKAAVMFDLISEYVWDKIASLDIPVYKIKGTNMFKLSEPPVREHAELFGDRLYELKNEEEKYILRYAACHQQFAAVRHWNISHKHLPFGTYENADSYRLERSGELLLCFRTRRMNMPDLHIFTRDLDEAKKITLKIHKKIFEEFESNLGRNLVNLYNLTKSFFNENEDYIEQLSKIEKNPILLHFVPENKYYWVINVEYNIIDSIKNPREIATFQIDTGNAKRFGIKYTTEDGKKAYPPIIHTAPIGTIERYLYTLFDTAALHEEKGEPPSLPLWVSPTQVRIIPTSKRYNRFALEIAKSLQEKSIRVDVDDRDESVGKKIANAEKDWVNYILVIGKEEQASDTISVRDRVSKKIKKIPLKEFIDHLEKELKNKPRIKSYWPLELSKVPKFR